MDAHENLQSRVRGVIESAITELVDIGMDRDGAASLLVIQGAIRIEDPAKGREAARFIASQFPEER